VLSALAATGCRFGVVSADADAVVRSLGAVPFKLETLGQDSAQRTELFRNALARAGATPDDFSAQFLASNFPLQIDGIAAALRLAQAHAGADDGGPGPRERFIEGCKAIAKQGISHLAEHIEPGFRLDDVVLPRERAEQLHEVVASVRLAPMVLDQWDFKRQLPYVRGTTVLFHGPSGTGKTMAAHGIAKALNVHLLRLDLSRVVSKYIGETEQHCDRVFSDAAQSGAAVLIDEADALFGKRSEVKDAHDRYANIEVAFLLQRIETFDGLAILTTNLRQNLDPAFLRRLRFIVEFPRPDVQARAAIWKSCLPPAAHRVSDEEIGDLARRIDLTGGHIRQITLRAAFLAADRGEQIELRHLLAAGRAELAKLGMPAAGLGVPTLAPARRVA
jgi:AAA+ superfamily predicted ATPase